MSKTKTTTRQPARAKTKQSRVIAMLSKPAGATIAAVMRTTGWQAHSTRGFFAAVVRKRLRLNLVSKKANGKRTYRVVASKAKTAVAKGRSL